MSHQGFSSLRTKSLNLAAKGELINTFNLLVMLHSFKKEIKIILLQSEVKFTKRDNVFFPLEQAEKIECAYAVQYLSITILSGPTYYNKNDCCAIFIEPPPPRQLSFRLFVCSLDEPNKIQILCRSGSGGTCIIFTFFNIVRYVVF